MPSPLRAPAGPPPPSAPPPPPVNGQRWSLNRALNHLNAICAPGPHLLPPTAARSVTPLPTGPARPPDPAANRTAAYSNRRAGAAPRTRRLPPLVGPRRPTGVVVLFREVLVSKAGFRNADGRPESWRRACWTSPAREPVRVPGHATRRRCAAGRHGARCRQLCQSFPLQGPSGVWGQWLVQLRRACWATARTVEAGSLGPPLTRSDGVSGPVQVTRTKTRSRVRVFSQPRSASARPFILFPHYSSVPTPEFGLLSPTC